MPDLRRPVPAGWRAPACPGPPKRPKRQPEPSGSLENLREHVERTTSRAHDGIPPGGERFTFGLVYDVHQVIEQHGYKLGGSDVVELRQHLFDLLHGSGTGCTGRTVRAGH